MNPSSRQIGPAPREDALAGAVQPDARLIRRGKFMAFVLAICLAATSLIDLAQILTMAMRMGNVAGLLNGGFAFILSKGLGDTVPTEFVPISHFAIWQSAMAAFLLALRLTPGLVALWNLFGLFRMYARGLVFTARNELHVRRIAWALLAYAAVPFLTHAVLYLAGMSAVAVKLEIRQIDAAVVGIILFALAYVVSFGRDIDHDREGFV